MVYQYGYLIGSLSILALWLVMYLWRKDVRREMLYISLIFGFIGLTVDPIYALDWWKALTITGTMPGIESFIFGFSAAGVASVIYVEFSGKRIRLRRANKAREKRNNLGFLYLLILCAALFLGGIFIFGLNSFEASFPAILVPTLIIWFKRKDLIADSLFSGALIMVISVIFYRIPEFFFPGWLQVVWNFEMLSGILLWGVVIEDIVWFFLAGLLIGPLYEYWQQGKLVKKK